MSERLVAGRATVWKEITRIIRRSRMRLTVAVAYLGKDGSSLLPLKAGSRLVVDASLESVRAGRTHPADLSRLQQRGVRVFTSGNLHAKVFVGAKEAIVGSTNASQNSAQELNEAVVITSNARVVAASRRYVLSLCVDELGPEELRLLQKEYRPPKTFAPHRTAGLRRTADAHRLRVMQLHDEDPPGESVESQRQGERIAKKKMEHPRSHRLEQFWYFGVRNPYRREDSVVQVVEKSKGKRIVEVPARVIHFRRWRRGNKRVVFIYMEQRDVRARSIKHAAKRIGYGGRALLDRECWVTGRMRERVLRALGD